MELQETLLVSEGEGEGMAVHRFAPDELVIQDAVEDVVSEYVHCDEDEDVAVETCVMALDGEEEGVAMGDIPEDDLDPEQQDDDQDNCGDYLMISCKSTLCCHKLALCHDVMIFRSELPASRVRTHVWR